MAHMQVVLPDTPLGLRAELVSCLSEIATDVLGLSVEQRLALTVHLVPYGKGEMARGGHLVDDGPCRVTVEAQDVSRSQKLELIARISDALCAALSIGLARRHMVSVSIFDVPVENVGSGRRGMLELVGTGF